MKLTKELKYYKETGYLTSSFTLNITMVFMDFLLDKTTIEGIIESLIQGGVSSDDAAIWKQAFKDYKEIEKKTDEFSKKCWFDINKKNEKQSWTSFKFTCENLTLLSMSTAGRILITIKPDEIERNYISLIGHEGSSKGCGFQGMHAKKDEALKFIDTIIFNWNPEKYCICKNVCIC